ncbi:DapH/DapD/GlmU-related protein [Chryseobacterium gotjawalense]|uniref:DapH/DapD/GlmU-related protein n=1 Tax=Chryseobacterium gotjawalense TaxID=3042315 RepID=A0ABY8RGG0_9FLAO|nr:DapH/DapD/GlmU-related protein [Chryseobacterium sp. wdc7]WHF53053.1 DapH/DapD/GlmU-related protein [Chryseobacterium sp. wdc7]
MKTIIRKYTILDYFILVKYKIFTLFFLRKARLIRTPIFVRGKFLIDFGSGLTTGRSCRIDAFLTNDNLNSQKIIKIGNNVEINDNVHIAATDRIDIGNNVLIASNVYISDHNHGIYKGIIQDSPLSKPNDRDIYSSPVIIEKNVWIGQYVCVLQGVTIGEGSIIGAMSVVNKDIPPYSIAVGSPAKVVKKYDFKNKIWISVSHD